MKKLLIILSFFLISVALYANELSWVDEQINAIKPPRKGISPEEISQLKNPFILLHQKKDKKIIRKKYISHRKTWIYSRKFTLEAILNKTALINGKWYKEGSKVYRYKLQKVNRKSVVLTRGKYELHLSTRSKDKNLKITNK